LIWFYGCVTVERIHPLEGGYLRRKVRTDRRPGLPLENPLIFYPRYIAELIAKHITIGRLVWRMGRVRKSIKADPNRRQYMDLALTPVPDDELENLEMFQVTQSARDSAAKAKRMATAETAH
jgi:hypothetical protein